MLLDFRDTAARAAVLRTGPAPVVVVGAGAAGIACALALEEAGVRVLLVESGGDPGDADTEAEAGELNTGEVAGEAYQGLTGGRARVLGGATHLWHGQCTRLHEIDLRERSWVPESGWPLPPEELEPWYATAEQFFGLTGAGYGGERWREHPGLRPVGWDASHLLHDFTEYTASPHLGRVHRRRLRRSASTTVLQHATAAGVVLEGARVTGVRLRSLAGDEAVVSATQVVLAAGAIENARLLQLSDPAGVGVGTGRWHTGRWLQDHAVVETLDVRPTGGGDLQDLTSHLHRGRRRLYPKVRLSPSAQQEHGLLDANAVLVHRFDDPGMEAARRLVAAAKERRGYAGAATDVLRAAAQVPPLARAAYRRHVRGLSAGRPSTSVRLQVWLEQQPDSESRVELGGGTDRLGLPVPRVTWRTGEAERRTSRVLSRWVGEDLQRLGLATTADLDVMHDDDAWRAAVGDAYHPSGTTRMSSDPGGGVVDERCRVHGVHGLSVAGSSVFPIAGYANPTLTIVALAQRLGADLAA